MNWSSFLPPVAEEYPERIPCDVVYFSKLASAAADTVNDRPQCGNCSGIYTVETDFSGRRFLQFPRVAWAMKVMTSKQLRA